MTLALIELGLAGALLYAGIKCVKLIPLLAGKTESSGECTGSLVAIVGAYLAAKVGSGVLSKIIAGAAGAGAGAATKKVLGRGGSGSTPEPAPEPDIPPVVPDVSFSSASDQGSAGQAGSQALTATVSQAGLLRTAFA